jgi:hypothetical protein
MTAIMILTKSRISFYTKRKIPVPYNIQIVYLLKFFRNGLAGIRTQGNIFQFSQRPLVVVYYNVDYAKDPKGSNYWRNRVLKVAQEYKRKVYFAVSNKEEFAQVSYW